MTASLDQIWFWMKLLLYHRFDHSPFRSPSATKLLEGNLLLIDFDFVTNTCDFHGPLQFRILFLKCSACCKWMSRLKLCIWWLTARAHLIFLAGYCKHWEADGLFCVTWRGSHPDHGTSSSAASQHVSCFSG